MSWMVGAIVSGRKLTRECVVGAGTTPENHDVQPGLPLLDCSYNVMKPDPIFVRDSSLARAGLNLESIDDPISLFPSQKAAGLWTIRYKNESNDGANNRQKSFNDKDPAGVSRMSSRIKANVDAPSPSFKTTYAIHLLECKGEKTTKCTGERGHGIKYRQSCQDFISSIEQRKKE